MNSKSKILIKNIGILTISNFASKILVFLLVPLYTSVLSTEDVGVYDLIVSTVSLLIPILTLNIVDAVMRFLMDKSKSKEEVATIGIRYVSVSILPVLLFLIVASKIKALNSIHGFEMLILLYYVFSCLYQYLVQFTKGIENVSALGVAGILGTFVMLTANIVLLIVFKAGLKGFFVANILGQAVPATYLLVRTKLWNYIKGGAVNKTLQREMLIYCVPLIATVVGWWVNSASDRYVVSLICGVAANGVLSVSYKIPQIINTLQTIFIQAWQISAVKEYGEADTAKFYGETFSTINVVMCAACAWLILLARPIASILYANDFYQAWQYVPYLLLSSVINCASGLLGPILAAKKNSKAMMWSAIIGAVANIFLNIVFVYLLGIQGATIATVISSYVIYLVRKKAVGEDIFIEDYISVSITWVLLFVQAFFESFMSLTIIEVVLMMVMLIVNMGRLKKLLSIIIKKQ